jgi:hypothetical protein
MVPNSLIIARLRETPFIIRLIKLLGLIGPRDSSKLKQVIFFSILLLITESIWEMAALELHLNYKTIINDRKVMKLLWY